MIMRNEKIKKNNNTICVICAKKNSRGLKNKNILKINNKELIIHTLDQAIQSKAFNRIVINTDSGYIIKILKKKYLNIEIINRPIFLRGEYLSKLEIIKYSVDKISSKYNEFYEFIVDLDVTSPLRNKRDILNSLNLIKKQKAINLVSVSEAKKNPYFNMVEKIENGQVKLVKKPKKTIQARQKAPKVFDMNASISIFNNKFFQKNLNIINKNTIIYEMTNCFDIDSIFDFHMIKHIIESKK
tara:strand:- start:844 stop:1569 length:726 start_codon:yes stop_codon:yes gene_type:complete